jgi:hypothetical protein
MIVMMMMLIAGLASGCAAGSKRGDSHKLDYCDCAMWGVTGMDPGPDYQPPPRPPACERILKRTPERACPIPA